MAAAESNQIKRAWLYAIGAILVIAAISGLIAARNGSENHSKNQPVAQQASSKPDKSSKRACSLFTLAEAKQVLGDNAKGGESTSSTSSADIDLSVCIYTQDSGSNTMVSSNKTASLLVRAPKTNAGTLSNQNQFSRLKPADAQKVEGYKDDAYWDLQYAQLNILSQNTWYIITAGPPTPAERTLDQAKQMADLIISKI